MMKNKSTLMPLVMGMATIGLIGSVSAATTLVSGGAINGTTASDWTNGAPAAGNPGTITVDGILTAATLSYTGIATVTHSAGNIVASGTNGFNFNQANDTWVMTGGTFSARFFNANSSTFNLSGGTFILNGATGTNTIQTSNGGVMNISGSFSVDGANASAGPTGSGSNAWNFASGWTGSWSQGNFSGTDWRDLVIADDAFQLNGVAINGATFDANFVVTNGGTTLSAVPEPSSTALLGLGGLALILRRRRA